MSLLVYNLTAAPLVLANGLSTTIPASTAGAGVKGEPYYASGNELEGRSAPEYTALQAQQNAGLVAFEWQAFQEYPTPGLTVGSAQTDVSDLDVAIYVDPAGNDTNPGTLALPVKTYARALAMVPSSWKKRCEIILAAGTYQIPPGLNRVGQPEGSGAPLLIRGAVQVLLPSFVSTSGGSKKFVDAAFGVTDYTGAYLRCLTGANAGLGILIKTNSPTQLETFNTAFAAGFPNNIVALVDTFEIVRPSSILQNTNTVDSFVVNTSVGFKDVKILMTTNGNLVQVAYGIYGMDNVDIELAPGRRIVSFSNGFYNSSPFAYVTQYGVANPFTSLVPGGFYAHCEAPLGSEEIRMSGIPVSSQNSVCKNVNYNFRDGGVGAFVQSNMKNQNFFVRSDAGAFFVGNIDNGSFKAVEGGRAVVVVTINNSPGWAIDIANNSYVQISTASGANNFGGLKVSSMSQIESNGVATVTGNGGVVLATTFTADPLTAGVVLDVTSTAGFPAAGFVKAGTEIIKYTSLNPLQFLGCTRGANGTIASAHAIASSVSLASGSDALVGAVPKAYGALIPDGFSEINGGGPTLNRIQ